MDANRDVFHFMNNDWTMDKKLSSDLSEVGTWTFKYTIKTLYPNSIRPIDTLGGGSEVTIDPAFTVQILEPDHCASVTAVTFKQAWYDNIGNSPLTYNVYATNPDTTI